MNDFIRLDYHSFDAYNEALKLSDMIERCKVHEGSYQERILTDKIYRSCDNLAYCMEHKFRLSGPTFSRPKRRNTIKIKITKYDYRNREGENSCNHYSKMTLKTSFGETEIKVPRDRNGEFGSLLVKKNQTTLTGDIEENKISMYSKGMTTSDIETHIKDIYGIECSNTTISRITDKILPVVCEWQSRLLEGIYAVVFADRIHLHVHSEGQIIKKLYTLQSASIWMESKKFSVCGLAKTKVQSSDFRL